jgi:hypothetical protein
MNSWWSLKIPVDSQHHQIPLSGSNFSRNRILDRNRTCIAVSLDPETSGTDRRRWRAHNGVLAVDDGRWMAGQGRWAGEREDNGGGRICWVSQSSMTFMVVQGPRRRLRLRVSSSWRKGANLGLASGQMSDSTSHSIRQEIWALWAIVCFLLLRG